MKTLRIIIILSCFNLYSQEEKIEKNQTVALQAYSRCFEGLKPIKFIVEKTKWDDKQICSLSDCIVVFRDDITELRDGLKERLHELAKLFVEAGTPITITNGMDSSFDARKKNENLEDENGMIYISIGECIITNEMRNAKDIFNLETTRLLSLK